MLARISAIRAGRIVLADEEAAGGHTILKHVGKTESELRARLAAEKIPPAASSFASLREAETAISKALRQNDMLIRNWAAAGAKGKINIVYAAGKDIGYGVVRTTGNFQKMQKVLIVLKGVKHGNKV